MSTQVEIMEMEILQLHYDMTRNIKSVFVFSSQYHHNTNDDKRKTNGDASIKENKKLNTTEDEI